MYRDLFGTIRMDDNKSKAARMQFALSREGKIVSVKDVLRGAACDCFCPKCGGKVIAKQGEIREWHFAHEKEVECTEAGETALHLAAKQIILEEGWIRTPRATETIEIRVPKYNKVLTATAEFPGRGIKLSNIELEKDFGIFKPDVFATAEGQLLAIEIAVSHFTDEDKRNKLKRSGIPTLEINLAQLNRTEWTWEDLRYIVVEDESCKQWIVNMNSPELFREALRVMESKCEKLCDSLHRPEKRELIGTYEFLGSTFYLEEVTYYGKFIRVSFKGRNEYATGRLAIWRNNNLDSFMLQDNEAYFSLRNKDWLIDVLTGKYVRKPNGIIF